MRTHTEKFWSYAEPEPNSGCLIWLGARNSDGYGSVFVRGRGSCGAHRVAYELTYGSAKLSVLHRCDNPPCIEPRHLYQGTQADNVRDRDVRQRRLPPTGSKNGRAKLTDAQVHHLKIRYATGQWSFARLGRDFGVDATTVHKAVRGLTW